MSQGNPPNHESGSALFVAMMMLVLMGALGIAALDTVTTDAQVAGFQNRATSAFYAADAGAAEARSLIRNVWSRGATPAFHTETAPATLGDTTTYKYGLPSYFGDPAVAPDPPIRYAKDGSGAVAANFGMNLQAKGQKLVETLWQINIEGQGPNGSRARVEVMESKILSKGYQQ